MSLRGYKPSTNPRTLPAARAMWATIALLFIALLCLALTACGSTESSAATEAASRRARLYNQQRAELMELVNCGRQHGLAMPNPTQNNQIDMRHVNVKGKRRKAALNYCYRRAVNTASGRENQERAREESQAGPAEKAAVAAQKKAQFQQERSQLEEVVSCARRHGIQLPEPDARNNINTQGLHIKSHRNRIIMRHCFGQVVARATKEQQAQAREQQAGPRRLGE
jgi:hypothetical protein